LKGRPATNSLYVPRLPLPQEEKKGQVRKTMGRVGLVKVAAQTKFGTEKHTKRQKNLKTKHGGKNEKSFQKSRNDLASPFHPPADVEKYALSKKKNRRFWIRKR